MSYIALYRKWRSENFDNLIGQDHIVRTLKNQISGGKTSHAYLFCGTRGTGKTSAARILARAINCLNQQNGEPCNVCEPCVNILKGRSLNVIEIDAASNNGVDNIREIKDDIKYPPTQGAFKVYIVDEVHMLSIGAFNALLKMLEEPPAHIVFILATTDPQKIPPTIHSRCQRFDFNRINPTAMADRLSHIAQTEGLIISDDAIALISRLSDGAMRDAVNLLEQCMAFYSNEEITPDKVLNIAGCADFDTFARITDAIFTQNSAACLNLVDEIFMHGKDLGQFTAGFVAHLRNLLVACFVEDAGQSLQFSLENIELLKEQGGRLNKAAIINLIHKFSEVQAAMKHSPNQRVVLEVALLTACNPASEAPLPPQPIIQEQKPAPQTASLPKAPKPKLAPPTEAKPTAATTIVPDDIIKNWRQHISNFPPTLQEFLKKTTLAKNGENLQIICEDVGIQTLINRKIAVIKEVLKTKTGADFTLETIVKTEKSAAPPTNITDDFDELANKLNTTNIEFL